jgi:hypothetical protein
LLSRHLHLSTRWHSSQQRSGSDERRKTIHVKLL